MITEVEKHQEKIETALRAMRLFDGFDGPDRDLLWWRTDFPDYGPVTMIVNCNDLLMWGCADGEILTAENIGRLEETIKEVRTTLGLENDELDDQAVLLWVCRERKTRPQEPYYKHLDQRLHALFDAAGPHLKGEGNRP